MNRRQTGALGRQVVPVVLYVLLASCGNGADSASSALSPAASFKTRNVVIVVADGERFTETWGDPERRYIPNMAALANEGVVFTAFTNHGQTATIPGHTAIATGCYDNKLNDKRAALPLQPTMFQVWLHQNNTNAFAAWIIGSKVKLGALGDTSQADWKGLCRPSMDCANRTDQETLNVVLGVLKTHHPRMVLINFSGPDLFGHKKNFASYLQAIQDVDGYSSDLWHYLQDDPFYAGQTAFFLVNDHGRHSGSGFAEHGCSCEGCRHIMLLALGPDFRHGAIASAPAEQIDLPVTAAWLMGCALPNAKGRLLIELFEGKPVEQAAVGEGLPVHERVSPGVR